MRAFILVFLGTLVILAVAIGITLIPSDEELALIRFRNKEYDKAFNRYLEMWNSGDRSIDVVIPLANLYLTHGEVDRAVEVMEEFVQAHPDNLEARIQLGTYYQYAQRSGDYVHNLEVISELKPTEERLRELSASYNFEGQYDKQIEVLKTLISLYPDTPRDFIDLAYLQASRHLYTDALETLNQLKKRHPGHFTVDLLALSCSLAIDAGQAGKACEEARLWLQSHQKIGAAIQLTALFNAKNQSRLAIRLLEPFESYLGDTPALLREWVSARISIGLHREAFTRLEDLYSNDRLSPELFPELTDLALYFSRNRLVLELADRIDPSLLENWLRFSIIEVLLAARRLPLLQRYTDVLSDADFQSRPVLRARIALAFGDQDEADKWMQQALHSPSLPLRERVTLADLFESRGDFGTALELLSQVLDQPGDHPRPVYRVARLFVKLDRAREGCGSISRLMSREKNPETWFAWALLSSASDQADRVADWLSQWKGPSPPEYLLDLYYGAENRSQAELAMLCARRLFEQQPSGRNRFLLASALLEAGDPVAALELIRPIETRDEKEDALYQTALSRAYRSGLPVGRELDRYWTERLQKGILNREEREEAAYILIELKSPEALGLVEELAAENPQKWIYAFRQTASENGKTGRFMHFLKRQLDRADTLSTFQEECLQLLLELGGPAEALPYLERFALQSSREWFFAYQDALVRLNRQEKLYRFWKQYAKRSDIGDEDRRMIAFNLLDVGHKKDAEEIFRQLAERVPARESDIDQLLYLWGPRPSPENLEWLADKARNAPGPEEQENWLQRLFDLERFDSVVEILEEVGLPEALNHTKVLALYARSLGESGRRDRLKQLLQEEIIRGDSVARLRLLAKLALEYGWEDTAVSAGLGILEQEPKDFEAHRMVGKSAFIRGDYHRARKHLEQAAAYQPNDPETLYYLGEVLRRDGLHKAAKTAFTGALQALESKRENSLDSLLLKAKLLNRLEQTETSIRLFRLMLSRYPSDMYLRADFASVLLEHKRYEEVEALLSSTGDGDD